MFRKTLVATTLSAALALSPVVATPAAAQERIDAGTLLLGAVAVGVIAKALENERDRERAAARAATVPRTVHDQRRWRDDDRRWDRGDDRWRDRDRHRNRDRGLALPARCEFTTRVDGRQRNVFGENCLQRAGIRPRDLPSSCSLPVRLDRRWYTAYSSRCLRQKGYRVEARWR